MWNIGVNKSIGVEKLESNLCGLTAMYGLHPTSMVLAMESTSLPEIPKSHNLNSPFLLIRMFEGFTSEENDEVKWLKVEDNGGPWQQ